MFYIDTNATKRRKANRKRKAEAQLRHIWFAFTNTKSASDAKKFPQALSSDKSLLKLARSEERACCLPEASGVYLCLKRNLLMACT